MKMAVVRSGIVVGVEPLEVNVIVSGRPMKTIQIALFLVAVIVTGVTPVRAQSASTLDAVVQRLDQLERQNAELREQVGLLRQELDSFKQPGPDGTPPTLARIEALEEKVEVNAGRLSEQEQVKVEGSQRAPLRVTGMALFNAYANGRHAAPDYPGIARINRGSINSGGTSRGTVFGFAFDSPEAVLGGQLHGSVLLDLFGDTGSSQQVLVPHPRLKFASIQGQWKTRSILMGQDRMIFAPREPNTLARTNAPLAGQGNLYGYRPQVRFEQKIGLGANQDVRAEIGVVETFEHQPMVQSQFASTLELRRPALEGHFQFGHRLDSDRRFEIASGFHWSTTHIAGTSIPATIFSVDGVVDPVRWLELTGFAYTGKNTGKTSGSNFVGFTILRPSSGQIQAIPVREWGGWVQATFRATPRLSVNLQHGLIDPNDDDLLATAVSKNRAYLANTYYRIAPNVIGGFEVAQVRTRYKAGQHPQNNHFDLYLAYMF